MGAYLSAPITEKESEDGSSPKFLFGASQMQGWRKNQEDAHVAIPSLPGAHDVSMFGVFDGHGGKEVSKFVAAHLPAEISPMLQPEADLGAALESVFHRMDTMLELSLIHI